MGSKPVKKPAAPKRTAAHVDRSVERLQARARDLEAWQAEVEDALAQGLNMLVGSKREAAEEAAEEAEEES